MKHPKQYWRALGLLQEYLAWVIRSCKELKWDSVPTVHKKFLMIFSCISVLPLKVNFYLT